MTAKMLQNRGVCFYSVGDFMKTSVLFVCMGNICRSPTAEGVFRHLLARRGLEAHYRVDSAGTHAYHIGKPPDARASRAAARRGISLDGQRARQVVPEDFHRFDRILAMDSDNLQQLEALCPPGERHRLCRMLDYGRHGGDVPDPYFGGTEGFEHVLDLLEDACSALLDALEGERARGRTA